MRGQVTISLAGGEVGSGAAPLTLVHRKADEICHFFYRIIEMTLHRPFRKRGSPAVGACPRTFPALALTSASRKLSICDAFPETRTVIVVPRDIT